MTLLQQILSEYTTHVKNVQNNIQSSCKKVTATTLTELDTEEEDSLLHGSSSPVSIPISGANQPQDLQISIQRI